MRQKEVAKNTQRKKEDVKLKKFNVLITGDNNYNNVHKMCIKLNQILNNIQFEKHLGTFGGKYGAELLGQIYAEQKEYQFTSFDQTWFKKTKKTSAQLYHILLSIGVKWADVVIIFSNIYTSKINNIITLCEKHNVVYFLIKE